ncbi:MAG: hypothetical protein HMLIMOIP_001249 [Candidatus Nitrosomirales archaeon]|jgi:hypothetical protein
MDWRFLAGGVAMIITGSVISIVYGSILLTGSLGELNPSRGIAQIGGIIGAIGVLLALVSFGLRRKKRRPDEDTTSTKQDDSS